MTVTRWVAVVAAVGCGVGIGVAGRAEPADRVNVVRDLANQVGPVVGSALGCSEMQSRAAVMINKVRDVIKYAGGVEADGLREVFDGSVSVAHGAAVSGGVNCTVIVQQMDELERSVFAPSVVASSEPVGTRPVRNVVATGTQAALPPSQDVGVGSRGVSGITDNEIRFGIVAPFSGVSQELGRQMKLGIDAAFNRANEAGGVNGRMLQLVAADDGYEPSRTLGAMKRLAEKDGVFGFIGNVGTPTAAVSAPYAVDRRMLFFGAFTGAALLRNDPPDRYVFNFRASYGEETAAVVGYLVRIRHIPPKDIAVFAQEDAYGDSGFAGVARAFRAMNVSDQGILRLGYKRNTIDVDQAVATLKAQHSPIKAVVMVATYRAAAKFIEKTRDVYRDMIYTNVSFVGSTELANELMLLGPRFANGVVVTQVVPAVGANSSAVLDYKKALEKVYPGELADYVSFEGYTAANVLIEALRRVGRSVDTEKLVSALEHLNGVDIGIGTPVTFGPSEHQASHKVWGTMLDQNGRYQPIDLE